MPCRQLGQLTSSFNRLKPSCRSIGIRWLKETMEKAFVIKGKKTTILILEMDILIGVQSDNGILSGI